MADLPADPGGVPTESLAQLKLFRRQYLQMLDLKTLVWPSNGSLRLYMAQEWIYEHMFDVENLRRPPPDRYRLGVLKPLLARIEKGIVDPEEDEISDNLMSAFTSLMFAPLPSEVDVAQQKAWVTYSPMSHAHISSIQEPEMRLFENRFVISGAGTTGLRTWEAALHLGSYLLSSSEASMYIRGKRVLELGAGTGFLSILCAQELQARHVLATDGDDGVVEALKTNMAFNNVDERMSAGVLKWGWALKGGIVEDTTGLQPFDTVIGADVTYDKAVIPALVSTIREIFENWPHVNVIVAATIRNSDTFAAFEHATDANGFRKQDLDHPLIPMEEQRCLFHSTDVPIRILKLNAPEKQKDPFAV